MADFRIKYLLLCQGFIGVQRGRQRHLAGSALVAFAAGNRRTGQNLNNLGADLLATS